MSSQQKHIDSAIIGRCDKHLLDDLAGVFRPHKHNNGLNHFSWLQYALLVVSFVLIVASVVRMGVKTIKVVV